MNSHFVAQAFCEAAGAENQVFVPQLRISQVKHPGGEHKPINPKALGKNLPKSEKCGHALGTNHSNNSEITHALDTTQNL